MELQINGEVLQVDAELAMPLLCVLRAGADTIYGNVAMLVAGLRFPLREAQAQDGFGRGQASRWLGGKLARELWIDATGGSSSVVDARDGAPEGTQGRLG